MIGELPLPGIEGSSLDPGDIWSVAILASVNQTSGREVCAENHEAPCDDTPFEWLHTLDRGWLEFAANLRVTATVLRRVNRDNMISVAVAVVETASTPMHMRTAGHALPQPIPSLGPPALTQSSLARVAHQRRAPARQL